MASHNDPSESDTPEPQAIDDDALELVTGGLVQLRSTPNDGKPPSYTTNSTIYFQTSITQNIT